MADAFDCIVGQPQVREFLRATTANDRISHAYLFAGPAGSNKTQAAYAFAQAILCPKGAKGPRGGRCGACDACDKVMRRKHPDVRYFAPEGANGYLIEQMREMVTDASMAPIQAKKKVYIIDRVDQLGTSAANAFLKTLEEPPGNVVFILLGRTCDGVLPTILSRCQVVPFRHIPASEAAGIVAQNTGASLLHARIAIEACGGSISRAIEFLAAGSARMEFRKRVLDTLERLRHCEDWDVVGMAADLIKAANFPLDAVRQQFEQELAQNQDFLAKSALRQLEARQKRQITAKSSECMRQLTAIIRSWIRDVMMICSGCSDLVINQDVLPALQAAAQRATLPSALCALRAVDECEASIAYNVSPEACIDALLFKVKEVIS
ncbi:ATP-binding protein [Parvibacter caecicola]|uniref:DNA polymerase III subunit n=1 Tax=Parvibacter caecicola TaxID=747645 RepID=UPI0023F54A72|nr:AAA family ATPase [Parvibacter caecicola]